VRRRGTTFSKRGVLRHCPAVGVESGIDKPKYVLYPYLGSTGQGHVRLWGRVNVRPKTEERFEGDSQATLP
jgi:hypothetical protein